MNESTLQRSFKSLLIAALAIVVVVAGVLLLSWLLPPSKAQQRSLAALQPSPQDHPGRNAHTALATLNLNGLSPAQRHVRVDAFIPRYMQWQDRFLATAADNSSATTVTRDAPTLAIAGDRQLRFDAQLCSFGEAATCLDKVRRQPRKTAEALAAQLDLLARIGELSGYGHYRMPPEIAPGIGAELPSASLLATPLAAHAQSYLQGDVGAAMTGLCRDAGSARMLMAHSDNLLLTMVGGKMLAANAQLLANLLAELPAETALPAECDTALSPLTGMEMSNCTGMRGEFAGFTALSRHHTGNFRKAHAQLFFNEEKSNARTAETMAWPCLPENLQQIAADRILPPPAYPSLWRLECAANYIGCVLSSIAAPSYHDYIARQQDNGAQLRLLQAVLWLREHATEQAGQQLAERLQALPQSLRQGQRSLRVSADGNALELPAHAIQDKAESLSMPIPKALFAAHTP